MDGPNRNLGTTDLLTVGLVVFFVSLLVLVAGLLFLPAVL
jgi:hypothetical protein